MGVAQWKMPMFRMCIKTSVTVHNTELYVLEPVGKRLGTLI